MAKLSISNVGSLGTFKNKIINGDFKLWQRGTSASTISSSTYVSDRFEIQISCDGTLYVGRSSTKPNENFNNSHNISPDSADTSIAAGQYAHLNYKVEGYDILPLMGKTTTLSFWVISNKTGTYSLSFRSRLNDYSLIKEYTINSASTWEFKSITFDMADGTTGTWNFTYEAGLSITWSLACGSTYTTTPNIWQSGLYFASTNQVNFLDSTDNYIRLTGIQLEAGSSATSFESRSIGQELALCQRYFQKSYDIDTAPGAATEIGADSQVVTNLSNGATSWYQNIIFQTSMRGTPTVTPYDNTGAAGKMYVYGDGSGVNATVDQRGNRSCRIYGTSSTATTTKGCIVHWAADAEL